MTRYTVAVVGAGIGGLTAAWALAREGHAVTLVERRVGFSEIGAGLQLSPNASRILLDLGLGSALRRVATEPDRVAIRSIRSGKAIGAVMLGAAMRERYGAPYWVVHRADLQTVLLDAVRSERGIHLLMGRTVETVENEGAAARLMIVKSSGARETLSADLVVGADGIWSSVRRVLGETEDPAFARCVAWRATIRRDDAPPDFSGNETGLWLGTEGHVVHYPVAGGRLLNLVALVPAREPVRGWAVPGDRRDLLKSFPDAAAPLKDLLSCPPQWHRWSLFDRKPRTLASGRVALLGDAGHPVLPFLAQGAALAIEDAAALCAQLRAVPLQRALKAYEAERLPRATQVQRHARRNGRIYHAGGLVALIRNQVMARLGPEGMTRRYDWLYAHRAVP